jgi:hypothetical protein
MFTRLRQIAVISKSNLIFNDFLVKKNLIEDEVKYVDLLDEVIENRLLDYPVEIKETIPEKPKEELITPKQSDTLFWCLFIIHFGYDEYLEVDRNYGVKELEVKKCIGEYLTANQHVVKNANVKITKACVQEILSELLTSQKDTSMNTLMAILFYYKINLIMVNSTRLLMLEFISDRDAELPYYVVYKDTYGKYSVRCDALTSEEVQEIKNKTICLESYLKPLKSVATYKVDELEDMAKKMGIYESNKKYKKTDLYQDISEACTWL